MKTEIEFNPNGIEKVYDFFLLTPERYQEIVKMVYRETTNTRDDIQKEFDVIAKLSKGLTPNEVCALIYIVVNMRGGYRDRTKYKKILVFTI